VRAIRLVTGYAVVFSIGKLKTRQWTRNPRSKTAYANFFRDRKKPRNGGKFRYPKFKKKR
jgi:transposase